MYSEYLCNLIQDALRALGNAYEDAGYRLIEAIERSLVSYGHNTTFSNWLNPQMAYANYIPRPLSPDVVSFGTREERVRAHDLWMKHSNQARLGWVETMLVRGHIEIDVVDAAGDWEREAV
ncbi:hypothetical protein H1O16_gp445 [Burkholderia phage BcepSaruman]|uniref:Uncharacterized protein n=1 Tax=Burkholderia phage BcepSaruman TaxID=2530032 RepID=A0A4D5ZIH4_9CAUD|nr:hypothetical protein H1O16_gp445 [Burkholderia phage BcepSaruman]QBX06858.1 hypothetical protein BcepSaruman_445 [Burkholderia phage BcepSaruman]